MAMRVDNFSSGFVGDAILGATNNRTWPGKPYGMIHNKDIPPHL
jgi:hypothetical protein